MQTDEQLKEIVKNKYSEIALQDKETNMSSCCGAGGCSTEVYNIMSEDYTTLDGYTADADLGLGCGLPTQFARIKKGDLVIDLGSGAGNDCFIARHETGETGKVIGIDFTPAMINKARANAEARGFNNVEFRQGDIENMPVTSNVADVIVSNCVLNLVPNKHNPEMYAGCVSGAIQKNVYLELIHATGFENVTIQKEKAIVIPDDILVNYLTASEITAFKSGSTGIMSITVFAQKPLENKTACVPGGGCC